MILPEITFCTKSSPWACFVRICTTLLLSCIKIQTSSNHSALDFATHKQVTGFLSLKLLCALFCHNQSLLGACKWGHASLAKLKRFSMTKERLFSGGTYQINHKSFENGTRRRNCQGLHHFCFILRLSYVCLPKKAKTAASQPLAAWGKKQSQLPAQTSVAADGIKYVRVAATNVQFDAIIAMAETAWWLRVKSPGVASTPCHLMK